MEFLTSCLWKFFLIYGILAFSDGNARFESRSPASSCVYTCVKWPVALPSFPGLVRPLLPSS